MRSVPRAVLIASFVILVACGQVPPSSVPAASPSSPAAGPTPLAISSLTFPTGEVGVPVRPFTVGASGGLPPYRWTVAAGTFPRGLEVASGGAVSGTPSAAGTFKFTLQVTDLGARSAWIDVSMTVAPVLSAKLLKAGTIVVERGHPPGAFASQSGGNPPYAYALKSGALPPGTTLSTLALAGAPTSTGSYSFSITITDSFGVTASVSASYLVFAPLAFPSRPSGQVFDAYCRGIVSDGCSASLSFSGGYPGTTPRITWYPADPITGSRESCQSMSTPSCYDLRAPTVSGGAVHVVFVADRTGVPGGLGWDGQVVVTLTDPSTGGTATAHFKVTVTLT